LPLLLLKDSRVSIKVEKQYILVNNARVLFAEGEPAVRELFDDFAEKDLPAEINISPYGVLNCTKSAIEPIIAQKDVSIIDILSRSVSAQCHVSVL
jgi:hypothetical protein